MNRSKLIILSIAASAVLPALASSATQGRIVKASACSQTADASYFSSAKQRDLKCKNIRLPDNDVCDASIRGGGQPSQISLDVPGLTEHRGTRRGKISFTKGGVIVYEQSKRTGAFKNKKAIFSSQAAGDQLEFELKPRGGAFQLNRVALYLDHTQKGNRLSWTEYTCNF